MCIILRTENLPGPPGMSMVLRALLPVFRLRRAQVLLGSCLTHTSLPSESPDFSVYESDQRPTDRPLSNGFAINGLIH
jgi:hypothetical protein